ncbi:DUF1553 domain-containing protein [Stieleria sp. JC731]|uniref:DUF1553 domain-containing protein n=1 Tax=Pirellulaceae TaxID=2691357 RepID=UPI001E5408BE|nr:DUF1553 domain-containing protein [Stieleria sp. JC731]MCC9600179.1 DUF1553 domain-containing protein [Stieleria sp. JC731]
MSINLVAVLLAFTTTVGESPVAQWSFDGASLESVSNHGDVRRDIAGPRPPEFPDLSETNTAIEVGASAYVSIPDEGPESRFDFANGDELTLEAWVNPQRSAEGQPVYIIGKGRTGSAKFTRDNQNWALRIINRKGNAHISFLFATKLSGSDRHWHRWTSNLSFPIGTGWHHVGVSYRFGMPESISGWVNGKPTEGKWDMGGITTETPINDDDEVRLGVSYAGALDQVMIHREMLDDQTMRQRFRRVGEPRVIEPQPEVMPQIASIPSGKVVVQLCERLPAVDRWLNKGEQWPEEASRWYGDSFLLPRIPLHFDSWGIRDAWGAPLLLRMAGDVQLPTGTHRFLIRSRAMSRLWIDGELVTRTDSVSRKPPDGEEPVTPLAEPPLPGVRPHGYNQQEAFGDITIDGSSGKSEKTCRVVFEVVVGGSGHRTETGEICVAMLNAEGDGYELLATMDSPVSLSNEVVEPLLEQIESDLIDFDQQSQRLAAKSQDEFWAKRHQFADQWIDSNRPERDPQFAGHPIDHFIESKIQKRRQKQTDVDPDLASHFNENVLPILREECFRCHGEKEKGGLRLNSREESLLAGDSEIPAVVPGDVEASELISQIRSGNMPPTEEGLREDQIATLETWVSKGAVWPSPPLDEDAVKIAPVIDDASFLRRAYFDSVGVPPTAQEVEAFLTDTSTDKRQQLIERLVEDQRFADRWVSFWMDILAENPSLLNASLNSTGPFRWFLYDSLRDNKPIDRMVTELIMLRGGAAEGGSAGFGLAGENDSPMAAKGHIIASAFLGIELQCARCHDSPYHSTTQKDLYSLAAMFSRKPIKVPATSRVPAAFFENQKVRKSLIQVSLPADQAVMPTWPFADVTGVEDGPEIDRLVRSSDDTRERLAALITAPQNHRFSQVIVNHAWKRLIGAGIVEPVHDWEGNQASHPKLLQWLADDFVSSGYDFRRLIQQIMESDLYQRQAIGTNQVAAAESRFFNAPDRRRLSAEQIVDALHQSTGHTISVEELTFVHDGRRPLGARQTLGTPTRAWMFGDLKNERDRPSLSLPRARAVADVLEAFGWTGARQMPIAERDQEPNVLQPGVLANGVLASSLTRVSNRSVLAELAIDEDSPEELVDQLFLRFLSRHPNAEELHVFSSAITEGYQQRIVPEDEITEVPIAKPLPQVDWFNHLRPQANEIQLEIEKRVQAGPPADPRLVSAWREVYEDVVWSLINHSEFVWIP